MIGSSMIQYYPAFEKPTQKKLYEQAGEIKSDRVAMGSVFNDVDLLKMKANRLRNDHSSEGVRPPTSGNTPGAAITTSYNTINVPSRQPNSNSKRESLEVSDRP